MKLNRASAFIAGGVTVLALGSGTAVAATGGSFLLGKSNTATTTTKLANSRGTALSLTSKTGTAPLAVNSETKVAHLNADRLDGLSSGSFARTKGQSGIIYGTLTDSDGYDNTAECPTGTIATGGGGVTDEHGDSLDYSGPITKEDGTLVPNSWGVASVNEAALAWVVCYNPRGAVPGAATVFPSSGSGVGGAKSLSSTGHRNVDLPLHR
jgi:hypothetical protein